MASAFRSDEAIRRCGQSSSICSTFHTFCVREPPVVGPHHAKIDDGVRLDAAGEVDVRLEVAERERAWRRKQRPPPVQARIARARDRSPSGLRSIDEDDVIEQVDRLEAQHERRIAMLLEDHGRRQRGFEAMRRSGPDDAAKAAQRLAARLRCCRAARSATPGPDSGVRRRATRRRSFGVSESAGGSTGSVRGSGRGGEVGNEFGRRP